MKYVIKDLTDEKWLYHYNGGAFWGPKDKAEQFELAEAERLMEYPWAFGQILPAFVPEPTPPVAPKPPGFDAALEELSRPRPAPRESADIWETYQSATWSPRPRPLPLPAPIRLPPGAEVAGYRIATELLEGPQTEQMPEPGEPNWVAPIRHLLQRRWPYIRVSAVHSLPHMSYFIRARLGEMARAEYMVTDQVLHGGTAGANMNALHEITRQIEYQLDRQERRFRDERI